jgi:hypothetical protein
MSAMGKALIVMGGMIVLLGVVLLLGDRVPILGHLPGDVRIERDGTSFYFPLTTCILLSIILTLVVNLVARLFGGR